MTQGVLIPYRVRLLSDDVRQAIDRAVASAPVVLFMKGTPETPQCGFSRASVQVLGMQGVDPAKFAAFNVLEKACEDFPRKLDVDISGQRPLDYMIPKFLSLADHPSAKMRSHAVACLSYFVPTNCQSLYVHVDLFIATLFKRASDDDPSVRRHVCQALVLLLAARPEKHELIERNILKGARVLPPVCRMQPDAE